MDQGQWTQLGGMAAIGMVVYAQLCVQGSRLARVEEAIGRLFEGREERLPLCWRHRARLDDHDGRLTRQGAELERLREEVAAAKE